MAVVLVVDDNRDMRETLAQWLVSCGHEVSVAEGGTQALVWLAAHAADALVSDLRMPGMDGLALLQEARQVDPALAGLLITAHGGVPEAVQAMRLGADDFLMKPFPLEELEVKLGKALARPRLSHKQRSLEAELGEGAMVGDSPSLSRLKQAITQVAATHSSVLLTGESGTGKELAARAIHAKSDRRDGPFVAVHCAALSAGLLESELFGHERGAFTGAMARKAGRFELAQGGTLFLDEVSEVPLEMQVKLLRVLQEREFERVGGTRAFKADFRLVAASNRDLPVLVRQGRFREDLYYRLGVVLLRVPSLRERGEDLPALAEHFARRFCAEQAKPFEGLDEDCLPLLRAHPWPGNIRELQNLVEQALVFSRGGPLKLKPGGGDPAAPGQAPAARAGLEETLGGVESQLLREALVECQGIQNRAAQRLGVSRSVLQYKVRKYSLEAYCRGMETN
jgi:DNA-binding NtrC family response regulator